MKYASLLIPAIFLFAAPLVAQWEPEVRLTYNDSASYTSANNAWCVAATGDTVHAVWYDGRDGNLEIYYKRSTNAGTNWDTDRRLTNSSGISEDPSVATTGTNVHVVWWDERDGNREIYTKRSTDSGVSWETDTRLTNDSADSYMPSIAVSGSNVHVVWYDNRDGNWEIYTKRSTDNGTTWGVDTRLTNDGAGSAYPSVAASGSMVHVAWYDGRDGDLEIYYKRSTDAGTSWGPDTRLTNNPANSWFPSLAASGSNVHVVWCDERDGNREIYTKRSTDSGISWGTDARLTNDLWNSVNPSVAVSGSNVHVVLSIPRPSNTEIYYKRSTDGGTTWDPLLQLTYNSFESDCPFVAVSGSKVHVVWSNFQAGGLGTEIYYKRNPTGNASVESSPSHQSPVTSYRVSPNPFTSFATVPGHEAEWFVLFDISGRMVGIYKGNRIGVGLAPGVYFLKSADRVTKPLRIVKVR